MPSATDSLRIVSPDVEEIVVGRAARCTRVHRAASLGDLWAALAAAPDGVSPTTLDLMGHSTSGHHLLRLGATPIDMLNPAVARFFREVAASGVLSRLRIVAVRLLGCETATAEGGQRTIRMLSRTLRLPVYGTLGPLMAGHHHAGRYRPVFDRLLVEASDLA